MHDMLLKISMLFKYDDVFAKKNFDDWFESTTL